MTLPASPTCRRPQSAHRSAKLHQATRFDVVAIQERDFEILIHQTCRVAALGVSADCAAILQYREDEKTLVVQAGGGCPAHKIGRTRVASTGNVTAGVPMKRPGQPAELAPTYVLLASQESSYVTGEVYGVTGGNSIS